MLKFIFMETMTVHPKTKEQLAALKAIAKALKVDLKMNDSSYDTDFVTEILKGETARKESKKGLRVNTENLWK